tara:strand:- start:4823 stop:7708 length:2886 start_codon:yes stop_codon:yes gene_type:complete
MEISSDEENFLKNWMLECRTDSELELECLLKKDMNRTEFSNILDFCRKRYVLLDDKRDSLDVNCGNNIRVTIEGRDVIRQFCRVEKESDKLNDLISVIYSKTQEDSLFLNEYNCKVNVKRERMIGKDDPDIINIINNWNTLDKTYRLKRRYSYTHDNFRVDLTVVKSNIGNQRRRNVLSSRTFIESGTKEAKERYEVEIEYLNKNDSDDVIESRQNLINIVTKLINVRDSSWLLTKNSLLKEVEEDFVSLRTKGRNMGGIHTSMARNKHVLMPGPQVVSMNLTKYRIMKENLNNYTVTSKTDGLRMLGFVYKTGELFLLSSKTDKSFERTGCILKDAIGSVFDGELVRLSKNKDDILHYLIFDCYYENGKDIRMKSLNTRISVANKLISSKEIDDSTEFIIKVKSFLSCDKLYSNVHSTFEKMDNDIYNTDGLIFTPQDPLCGKEIYENDSRKGILKTGNTWDKLLKWKDRDENTIDFRVIFGDISEWYDVNTKTNKKYRIVTLKTKGKVVNTIDRYFSKSSKRTNDNEEYEFQTIEPEDMSAHITKIEFSENGKLLCENGDEIVNGSIVEMRYDLNKPSRMRWIPRNVRFDKSRPNATIVAMDIWNILHFPVTKEMLTKDVYVPSAYEESEEYYVQENHNLDIDLNLRRFHTTVVKNKLLVDNNLNIPKGGTLLDLASGRGGDLNRYMLTKFNKIVGVDNSLNNLHHPIGGAYARLSKQMNNKKDIVFLHGDVNLNLHSQEAFSIANDTYKKYGKELFSKKHSYDMITMFFALHYMFENGKTLRKFVENLTDNLKVGGYFVGCCYDGEKVFNSLEKSGKISFKKRVKTTCLESGACKSSNSNDVEFLSINREYDSNKKFYADASSLGLKIKVLVQTIGKYHEEYLVNFDYLKKVLLEVGFECVHTNTFETFYEENSKFILSKEEKTASFMNRSFVFKRVSILEKPKNKKKKIQTKKEEHK